MYKEWSGKKHKLKLGFNDFNKIKLRNIGIGLIIISNMGLKTLANEEINFQINNEIKEIKKVEIETKKVNLSNNNYEIKPEKFMRKMGMNLCASYVKLIAQSKGYELNKVIYMNAWEMAYNMHKEGWNYVNVNEILNLIMLKTNIENKYYESSLKRIERAKGTIYFFDYEELKNEIKEKEFDTAKEKISGIVYKKFDELPDGTLLFTINRNSNYRNRANNYRKGAPTHVIIKSNNMWRDYDVYNERVRTSEEMLNTTKNITHIITPPEITTTENIDIEIPNKILEMEGKRKLNKAIEFSQYKDIGMWQYLSYRIYESNETGITIKKNIIENEKTISVQGKSYGRENL